MYGNIIGSITELARKSGMESDMADVEVRARKLPCSCAISIVWRVSYDSSVRVANVGKPETSL